MNLYEAQDILEENGYLMESTEDDIVAQIAKVIGGVYESLYVGGYMELNEAQEILKQNGYIIEGWKDDMAEWNKISDKKYSADKYNKFYKTFNLGYGFIAKLQAYHLQPNPRYHEDSQLTIYNKNVRKEVDYIYFDPNAEKIEESDYKKLKRSIIKFAADYLEDEDEMMKVIKNLNKMINKINGDWLGVAKRRNDRVANVSSQRREAEYDARMKLRKSWNNDMNDKVGTKVIYKHKRGTITDIVKDKDNDIDYYKIKWDDNGRSQKVKVTDSDLRPAAMGPIDWWDR